MATWTAHDSLWLCDDFQSLWERLHNQGLQILWKARACAKLVIEYFHLIMNQHFSYRNVLSKTIDVLGRIWGIQVSKGRGARKATGEGGGDRGGEAEGEGRERK